MQTIDVTGGYPEYSWPTTITEATGKDISAATVQVTLAASDTRAPDVNDAAWRSPDVDAAQSDPSTRVVQLLIGAAYKPAVGAYYLWTQIADTPEIAPRRGARITIT